MRAFWPRGAPRTWAPALTELSHDLLIHDVSCKGTSRLRDGDQMSVKLVTVGLPVTPTRRRRAGLETACGALPARLPARHGECDRGRLV
jgi:hypothetical protein